MSIVEAKIKIEPNIFKAISKRAKNEGTTVNKIINDILKREVKNKETAIERVERLTNGKAEILNKDTYNNNPTKKDLNSIVGLMDAPKGFDVVKAVEDANVRKLK